jgi:RES domain-containing protein
MIVYRFAHPTFAMDLSGTGAKLCGGRWNPTGIPVVYASESISLALLEVLANAGTLHELQALQLVEINIPPTLPMHDVKLAGLKKDWFYDFDYTQWMGQEILLSKKNLIIQCPSAIVHKEKNYLLNPLHIDIQKIKMYPATQFYFDQRLFKQIEA